MNRTDLGYGGSRLEDNYFPLWHYAHVENIEDEFNEGRIQVRLEGVDRQQSLPGGGKEVIKQPGVSTVDLVWCEPLMPKYLNIVPQKGEMVRTAVFNYQNKYQRRVYMGPVIGQQTVGDFTNPSYQKTKLKVENSAYTPKWTNFPQTFEGKDWKVWPNKDDIAIIGRVNTDLILRDKPGYNEIILRSGKMDWSTMNNPLEGVGSVIPSLNLTNPAYITINNTLPKTNATADEKRIGLDKSRTHVNIVADSLNLISHLGSSSRGKSPTILNGEDSVKQLTTEKVRLHPVIYGDKVWEFMDLMRNFVNGHIHVGDRLEPDGDKTKNDLIAWFKNNMGTQVSKQSPEGGATASYVDFENCTFLSKGVKIN